MTSERVSVHGNPFKTRGRMVTVSIWLVPMLWRPRGIRDPGDGPLPSSLLTCLCNSSLGPTSGPTSEFFRAVHPPASLEPAQH